MPSTTTQARGRLLGGVAMLLLLLLLLFVLLLLWRPLAEAAAWPDHL